MVNCYWVMAGLTDMHFLYWWEPVKDLLSPIVKNGYQFSRPQIGIKRPCPRPGHTKWATPILTHGPTDHEACQHQFSDQPTWLVWDLVQLFTEVPQLTSAKNLWTLRTPEYSRVLQSSPEFSRVLKVQRFFADVAECSNSDNVTIVLVSHIITPWFRHFLSWEALLTAPDMTLLLRGV